MENIYRRGTGATLREGASESIFECLVQTLSPSPRFLLMGSPMNIHCGTQEKLLY
jgi:hypothetical protein